MKTKNTERRVIILAVALALAGALATLVVLSHADGHRVFSAGTDSNRLAQALRSRTTSHASS
jgi:hypothetical protein